MQNLECTIHNTTQLVSVDTAENGPFNVAPLRWPTSGTATAKRPSSRVCSTGTAYRETRSPEARFSARPPNRNASPRADFVIDQRFLDVLLTYGIHEKRNKRELTNADFSYVLP